MGEDLDIRRRRAIYRAGHRGTKEMDVLVGRYADERMADMTDPDLQQFEEFLSLPDPMLQNWIFGRESPSETVFVALVTDIRQFHGLEDDHGATT